MTITNHDQSTFEDRLGRELRAMVAERPHPAAAPAAARRRRRRARPAVAFGTATAAAIAGIIATQGGSPAFAVESGSDGDLTIEIRSLTDASGLERDLAAAGVKAVVDYLAPGKVCAGGRFELAQLRSPIRQGFRPDGTGSLTIRPADFPAGTTLVLTSAVDEHRALSTVGVASGAVKPCTPVDAAIGALPPLPAGAKDGKLHTAGGLSSAGGGAGLTVEGSGGAQPGAPITNTAGRQESSGGH